MTEVINIEKFRGKPLLQLGEGLTEEQLSLFATTYLTQEATSGQISPRLYNLLERFGWVEQGKGVPIRALVDVSIDELVVSTRTPRKNCRQYGLGPAGLEELQTVVVALLPKSGSFTSR